MSNRIRGFILALTLALCGAGLTAPTASATPASAPVVRVVEQTQQVQQTLAQRRVRCTDKDRRGIRYSTRNYRVGARCESKKWASFSGSGVGALVTAMCTVVAALGSPVGGALCVTIVAATAITIWTFVRAVRNDGKCFGVIREWRMGLPLLGVFDCRYERPPGAPRTTL